MPEVTEGAAVRASFVERTFEERDDLATRGVSRLVLTDGFASVYEGGSPRENIRGVLRWGWEACEMQRSSR